MDWFPSNPQPGAPPPPEKEFPFINTITQGLGRVHPKTLLHGKGGATGLVNQLIVDVLRRGTSTRLDLPSVSFPMKQYFHWVYTNPQMQFLASYFGGVYEDGAAPAGENATVVQFFAKVADRLRRTQGNLPAEMTGPVDPEWDRLTPSGGLAKHVLADALRYGREHVFTKDVPHRGIERFAEQPVYVVPFVFRHSQTVVVHWTEKPVGDDDRLRWGGVAFIHNPRALGTDEPNLYVHVVGYVFTGFDEVFWLQTVEPAVVSHAVPSKEPITIHAAVCDPHDRTTVCGYFSAYLSGALFEYDDDDVSPVNRQYALDLSLCLPRREPAFFFSRARFSEPPPESLDEFYMAPDHPIAALVENSLPPALVAAYRMLSAPDEVTGRARPSLEQTARAIVETLQIPDSYMRAYVYDLHSFQDERIYQIAFDDLDPAKAVKQSSRTYSQVMRFLDIDAARLDVFFDSVALMLIGEGRAGEIALEGSDVALRLRRLADPVVPGATDIVFEDALLGRALLTRLVTEGPDLSRFPFRIREDFHRLQVVPLPFVFRSNAADEKSVMWQWGGIAYLCDMEEALTGRQLVALFDGFVITETPSGTRLFRAVSDDEQRYQIIDGRSYLFHFHLRLRSLMKGDARRGFAYGTWGYTQHNANVPTVAMISVVIDETDGARAASGDQ